MLTFPTLWAGSSVGSAPTRTRGSFAVSPSSQLTRQEKCPSFLLPLPHQHPRHQGVLGPGGRVEGVGGVGAICRHPTSEL